MNRSTSRLAAACLPPHRQALAAERLDRGLVALRTADGPVYVGWRFLSQDGGPADERVGFHVYRRAGERGALPAPTRLTAEPVRRSTDFVDLEAPAGASYAVAAVVRGRERARSPFVPAAGTRPGRDDGARRTTRPGASYVEVKLQGEYVPQKAAIGDLDGDGRYDYVIKQPNFNVDPYHKPGYWKKSTDTFKIEAYSHDGRFLWRHDMGWSIEEGIWYSPYVVYDLDGDGRAEVYCKGGEGDPRDPDGRVTSGPEWLFKIDGRTGSVVARIPWPDRAGCGDYNYYCRNFLAVAYLDGRRPHLVVQRGTYRNIKMEAYDGRLRRVWRWYSADEKVRYGGQGSHTLLAADVDGDGRDEIVAGAFVIDDDGRGLGYERLRHTAGSADSCRPAESAGRAPLSPAAHERAAEKDSSQYWLYSAAGKRIGSEKIGGLAPWALWWDSDPQRELALGSRILDYRGKTHVDLKGAKRKLLIADVLGDWREELVASAPGELRVYTTTVPAETRRTCLMQDRLYRLCVAVSSMGYNAPPQHSRPWGE